MNEASPPEIVPVQLAYASAKIELDAARLLNKSLHSAIDRLKEDILKLQADRTDLVTIGRAARAFTRNHCNVTTRRFAAICGMSPTRLCELIGEMPTGRPDFVD